MRLWSIHPSYLDSKGLVALWREVLLAQKVLKGETKGYKNHPQLERFKNTDDPLLAIASYLMSVAGEADKRGFDFDRTKILNYDAQYKNKIMVTKGQVLYEFEHLIKKLDKRDLVLKNNLLEVKRIKLHPIFKEIEGDVENWEIIK